MRILFLLLIAGCVSVTEPNQYPMKYHGHGEWVGVLGAPTTDTITVLSNDTTLRCTLVEYSDDILKRTASYEFKNRIDGIDTGYIENNTFFMKHPVGKIGISAYLLVTATR